MKISSLRREVQRGIEQADRGQFVDFTAEQIVERRSCTAKTESGLMACSSH